MAQERPSTPEKQLLNLIEDPKERDVSHEKIKRRSFNLFSFAALRARISFFVGSVRSVSAFKKAILDLKGLNKILQLCVVVLFLYFIASLAMSIVKLKEIPEFVSKNPRLSKGAATADFFNKRISDYLEGPRVRNIFKFGNLALDEQEAEPEEEVIEEVAPPVEITLSKAELLSQELGLVGIGWSDDPDVMIKNVGTGKMYFLKSGQRIDGLITVEAIFPDRVILTYDDGKEMELR